MQCELYECFIDGVPVTCQIVETDDLTGHHLVEYRDVTGPLRKWVNPDILVRTPQHEISQ